jgi:hypothetical protein
MTKRFLTCSCCGGDAGEFEQWPNRDKGYGLCASCVVWLRKPREATGQPRMSEADIAQLWRGWSELREARKPVQLIALAFWRNLIHNSHFGRFSYPATIWTEGNPMAITYGTAYFPTLAHAASYYRPYGYNDLRGTVLRKVNAGEIHIGKPKLKPGQRLILIDNGTRYAIEESEPTRRTTTQPVTVTWLAEMGAAAACRVTIPAGTRAKLVEGTGGGWVVEDVDLLVRLTGNSHDPHYRYLFLPAEAFA